MVLGEIDELVEYMKFLQQYNTQLPVQYWKKYNTVPEGIYTKVYYNIWIS